MTDESEIPEVPEMKFKPSKLDKYLAQLEQSDMFFKLIRKVGKALGEAFFGEAPKPEVRTIEVEKVVEKEKQVPVTPDWAKGLEEYERLLTAVSGHAELRPVLLAGGSDKSLLTLLANASQWDNLLRVWDVLASKCKAGHDLNKDEQAAVQACMKLYNLTLLDRQAAWQHVAAGGSYDYEQHQRVGNKGERIKAQVMPGIINAGGIITRKVLVRTE